MENKYFIKEVKAFLLYSALVWPLHRKISRKYISPRCRKCVISSNYIALDRNGICPFCNGQERDLEAEEPGSTPENLAQLQEGLDKVLLAAQNYSQSAFDAIVLFSGGKDSCYLVHCLRQRYPSLRLLLVTIDNTIMSPVAIENIDRTVKRFDLDHILIRPPAKLYNKMFRYAFLHLGKNGCSGTVDQFDGDFFHDVARNLAMQMSIPYIISGCSRAQVKRILGLRNFESPLHQEGQKRIAVDGISLKDIFDSNELNWWWDPAKYPGKRPARMLYPFYAWNLEEDFIRSEVLRLGYVEAGKDNPLLTNNQLIPLMALVDMNRDGYSSFEPEFSQMVRAGKADPKFWKNIFEMSEYSAKTGKFISKSVDVMLARLKLDRQDVGLP